MSPSAPGTSGTRRTGFYAAEIDTLDGGAVVPLGDWMIFEGRQGWRGFGVVDPGPGEFISKETAFQRTLDYGLSPEAPVAVGLWVLGQPTTDSPLDTGGVEFDIMRTEDAPGEDPATKDPEGELFNVRTWPSVITEVAVPTNKFPAVTGAVVNFCDPLTYLLRTRIWGAYRNVRPAALLGGAMTLAVGGDGVPTLTPTLTGMPVFRIQEDLSGPIQEIPYCIAAGETLGYWLASLFGRLGIRVEMVGRRSGRVDVFVRDSQPKGDAVPLTLLPGKPSAMNAVISGLNVESQPEARGVLVDGAVLGAPSRVGEESHSVGELVYGFGIDTEQATHISQFEGHRSQLDKNSVRLTTGQPGLHPGRLLEFLNRSVSGAYTWQVARVWHGVAEGMYRNTVDVVKSGLSWRPDLPMETAPVALSALVDDGASKRGAIVKRDPLGRIPVTLGLSIDLPKNEQSNGNGTPEQTEDAPASNGNGEVIAKDSSDEKSKPISPPPVRLDLIVTEPMAGANHGFVVNHRQGDICRVSVHHPLWAEISGFAYGYDGRPGKSFVDSTAAVVVGNLQANWKGMVFLPAEEASEEDVDVVADWRANKPDPDPVVESDPIEAPATPDMDTAMIENAQTQAESAEGETQEAEAEAETTAEGVEPPTPPADDDSGGDPGSSTET